MVLYKSDDGIFDAPIEKVWKLIESHTDENTRHIHPGFLATKTIEAKGNVMLKEFTMKGPDGKPMQVRMRFTVYAPAAMFLEWITGPMAGSWCTSSYVPEGNKTRVVTIGDFHIPGLDDASIRKVVNDFMDGGFGEDNAYLKKL